MNKIRRGIIIALTGVVFGFIAFALSNALILSQANIGGQSRPVAFLLLFFGLYMLKLFLRVDLWILITYVATFFLLDIQHLIRWKGLDAAIGGFFLVGDYKHPMNIYVLTGALIILILGVRFTSFDSKKRLLGPK